MSNAHLHVKSSDSYKPGDIVISAHEINNRLEELTNVIYKDYKNHPSLLIIGLLTGGAWLTVDLFSKLHARGLYTCELSFIHASSYPIGTQANFAPKVSAVTHINTQNKHILLVDDIIDTGQTLSSVEKKFLVEASSVQSFVLLDKPSRRTVSYRPKYVGFTIPDIWVQGHGMDSDGYGRGEANIIMGPYKYK